MMLRTVKHFETNCYTNVCASPLFMLQEINELTEDFHTVADVDSTVDTITCFNRIQIQIIFISFYYSVVAECLQDAFSLKECG